MKELLAENEALVRGTYEGGLVVTSSKVVVIPGVNKIGTQAFGELRVLNGEEKAYVFKK